MPRAYRARDGGRARIADISCQSCVRVYCCYAGDTLWALMVFLVVGLGFPRLRTSIVAAVAIAVAFTVETSQLYQSDWINQIRATRPGALLLGVGFLWSDFVCYTVGILIGYTGESLCLNLRVNKSVNKSE